MSPTDRRLRLASVGDDGSVHVSIFDRHDWIWTREYSSEFSHQSPATGKQRWRENVRRQWNFVYVVGIRFVSPTAFLSIGIDQRLKFWLIDSNRRALELRKTTLVDIRDILSMDMISSDEQENYVIAIAGAGIQTIGFNARNQSFQL